MTHRDRISGYIPKHEIDDVEDDETDSNYIDPRRSPTKLKLLAIKQSNNPELYKNLKLREFARVQTTHANKVRMMLEKQ